MNELAESVDNLVRALFKRGRPLTHGAGVAALTREFSDRVGSSLERMVDEGWLTKEDALYLGHSYTKYSRAH